MNKGYLSEQEEYEIECAIYNDDNKTLYSVLPKGVEDNNDGEVIKALAKGKEYYIVPDTNIVLIQDGSLFNAKFIRRLKPLWTPHDILINANRRQVRYTDIYKEKGWTFNHREIVDRYIKNNWPISITYGYKEKYKELYL